MESPTIPPTETSPQVVQVPPATTVPSAPPAQNKNTKLLLLILIIIGFLSAFGTGFFLKQLLQTETPAVKVAQNSPLPQASPTPSPTDDVVAPEPTPNYVAGKKFFEDTLMFVADDDPHVSLIMTINRLEQDSGSFSQNTRLSFFDGTAWKRETNTKATADSNIGTSNLINQWQVNIDKSRVLKEDSTGKVTVGGHVIDFKSGVLENEISMRSLPGYTKFISNGEGSFTVDGKQYFSKVLYTKIYSMNSADIQFYNDPFGLTTDWVAFWDNDGNFYHVDDTHVDKPTEIYGPHQIGIFEDSFGVIAKTFEVNVTRDSSIPPSNYSFQLGKPANHTLNVNLINAVNKVPSNAYQWYFGQIKGSVTKNSDGSKVDGFGLMEYIHN